MKPLANGGIGDTEMIPTSSTPRLVFSHPPAVLVLAPSLDPQTCALSSPPLPRVIHHCSLPLCPHRHSSCQDTLASKPQAISMPASSHFHWGSLLVCTPDVSVLLLFSVYGLLLYYFQLYFLLDYWPLWPCASPLWLPVFLLWLIISSCTLCRVFFTIAFVPSSSPSLSSSVLISSPCALHFL